MATGTISLDFGAQKHYKHTGFSSTITDSYQLSYANPVGISWDAANVLGADNVADKHYKHTGFSSAITDSYSSPDGGPRGIAWDGTNVISASDLADKHFKHSGFSDTITDSYASPFTDPQGIAWDGTNVLSVDLIRKHYKHDGFSDTITDSYTSPSTSPRGIGWDGTNVISNDSAADRHYKHDGFSDTITDSHASPSTSPMGIDWAPNLSPTAPTSLLCEGETNLLSVYDTTPEFSAILNDPDTGDTLTHVKIEVDDDSGFGSQIWQSDWVDISDIIEGNRCEDVSYAGSALTRGTKYYWRIRAKDGDAAEGAWSTEEAYFSLVQILSPTGIASAEAFGAPQLNLKLEPVGIASGEAFGACQLNLTLKPTGIAGAETFGTPQLNLTLKPVGITSAEAFGAHQLNLTLEPTGIASAEAFGTAEVFLWGRNAGTRWGDGALWGDTTLWGDKPGWGTGKLWGTGVLWGQRPLPYPRGNHIRLEIRTASGSDYTAKAIDTKWRIESVLSQRISQCYFTFRDTSASDIDDHDEVIITDQSQTRLFAGFVESFEARPDGVEIEYDVVCVDYSWYLSHPVGTGGSTGIRTKFYEAGGYSDADILKDIFEDHCPEIDAETHVSELIAAEDMGKQYYENMTPRQILDSLCRRSGGEWYVDYGGAGDYKAALHYYEPGDADAPFSLTDGINISPVDSFPYGDLVKRREHGHATRVIVEGSPQLAESTTRSLPTDGTTVLELPYRIQPRPGRTVPTVTVEDVSKLVGRADAGDTLGVDGIEALWYPGERYLEFLDALPDTELLLTTISCGEWVDSYGVATDATGYAKYGRHLTVHVKDQTIYSDGTAERVAAKLLDRWKTEQDTYTCVCWEHGLQAGQVIQLTNADLGLSAEEFTIQRVSGRGIGGDLWEYGLELGKYIPDIVDTSRDLQVVKMATREHEELWGDSGGAYGQPMFAVAGTLSVSTDAAPWYICGVPYGLAILGTALIVKTAPVGAAINVDIERSTDDGDTWATIYSSAPSIADGSRAGTGGTLSTVALDADDLLRLTVDQVGSTTAGADLTVSLRVRQ